MRHRAAETGVALVETLVAAAVSTAMLAALTAGAIALQRGYSAMEHQVISQEDQMRAMDYLTRDLQRASTVQWSNEGRMLTVTVPDQSTPSLLPISTAGLLESPLRTPSLLNGVLSYGGTPISISYYIEGKDFLRIEAGARTSISTTIEEFIGSTSGSLATFQLAFTPKFSRRDPVLRRAGARVSATVFLRNVNRSR